MAFAQGNPSFIINLNGTQEVPPVQTEATGLVEVTPGLEKAATSVKLSDVGRVQSGFDTLLEPLAKERGFLNKPTYW